MKNRRILSILLMMTVVTCLMARRRTMTCLPQIHVEVPQCRIMPDLQTLPGTIDLTPFINMPLRELSPEAQAFRDSVEHAREVRDTKLLKRKKGKPVRYWDAYMEGYDDGYEDGADMQRNLRFNPKTRQNPYFRYYNEGYREGYFDGFQDNREDYILEGWVQDEDAYWDDEEDDEDEEE